MRPSPMPPMRHSHAAANRLLVITTRRHPHPPLPSLPPGEPSSAGIAAPRSTRLHTRQAMGSTLSPPSRRTTTTTSPRRRRPRRRRHRLIWSSSSSSATGGGQARMGHSRRKRSPPALHGRRRTAQVASRGSASREGETPSAALSEQARSGRALRGAGSQQKVERQMLPMRRRRVLLQLRGSNLAEGRWSREGLG